MICAGPDCLICKPISGARNAPGVSAKWALAAGVPAEEEEPETKEQMWERLRPWYQRTPDHDYMDLPYNDLDSDPLPKKPRPAFNQPATADEKQEGAAVTRWGGVKVDPVAALFAEVDREIAAENPASDWVGGDYKTPPLSGHVEEALQRTGMTQRELCKYVFNGVFDYMQSAVSAHFSVLDHCVVVVALPEQSQRVDDPNPMAKYLQATAYLKHEILGGRGVLRTTVTGIHFEA